MKKTGMSRMMSIFLALLLVLQPAAFSVQAAELPPISDYTIIFPLVDGPYSYTYDAALLLQSDIYKKTGYNLEILPDSSPETAHEILLGSTNRDAGGAGATYATQGADEYYLSVSDAKIVLQGEAHLVGAAAGQFSKRCVGTDGAVSPSNYGGGQTRFYSPAATAKNVIYFIGDGVGPNHIKWYNTTIAPAHFAGDDLASQGYLLTDSLSGTTDSAAGATALACGYKTANGVLGMDATATVSYPNIREALQSAGFGTAVLTTDVQTGATPSGFTVHNASRGNTLEISGAQQALLDAHQISYLEGSLGLQSSSEFEAILDSFSNSDQGFFLMYEAAHPDKFSHNNDAGGMLSAMAGYDKILKYAMVYAAANPETILLATSDHETGGITQLGDTSFQFTSNNHTSTDVRMMSMGPGMEYFHGRTVENTCVPILLAKQFGLSAFGDASLYAPEPSGSHMLHYSAAIPPTCTAAGSTAYWQCGLCGNHFSDAAGTQALSEDSTVLPPVHHHFISGVCTVCGASLDDSVNPFTDVSSTDALYQTIIAAQANGWMIGTAQDRFSPNVTMSRAMVVTILHRVEGAPAPAGSGTFTDVPADAYYASAVAWAKEQGVVLGYSADSFVPNRPMTREQLVAVMWRYARHRACDLSDGPGASAADFLDSGDVSTYAAEPFQWAVSNGIVQGSTANTLMPKVGITRAQAAAILVRFANHYGL